MTATAPAGRIRPALATATEETGFLLRLAHVRGTELLATELPHGLLPRYHEILAALAEFGPRSQQQLARQLGINRTIMVGLIDAMEQAGLLERRRNPADRRSYALEPTGRAAHALADMNAAAQRADARLTAALSTRERRCLAQLLTRIVESGGRSEGWPAALAERSIHLLTLAHRTIGERFERRLRAVGLTPPLYGTLRTLEASGPTSQQAIADELGLSGTAILQTVDRLEADQLVERRRKPADRRSYALELTSAGRGALGQVRVALDGLSSELDGALGDPDGQRELRRLLAKVLSS